MPGDAPLGGLIRVASQSDLERRRGEIELVLESILYPAAVGPALIRGSADAKLQSLLSEWEQLGSELASP